MVRKGAENLGRYFSILRTNLVSKGLSVAKDVFSHTDPTAKVPNGALLRWLSLCHGVVKKPSTLCAGKIHQ